MVVMSKFYSQTLVPPSPATRASLPRFGLDCPPIVGIAAVSRRAGDEILIPTIARPVLARSNDVTSTQPFLLFRVCWV